MLYYYTNAKTNPEGIGVLLGINIVKGIPWLAGFALLPPPSSKAVDLGLVPCNTNGVCKLNLQPGMACPVQAPELFTREVCALHHSACGGWRERKRQTK